MSILELRASRRLPPEVLDYIVDLLHDSRETLRDCCLVSKSWIPRTRTYLFADIKFESPINLEAWKKTFPDPAHSPGYHTRSLFVNCLRLITTADAEEGGWIRAFPNVANLEVWNDIGNLHEPMDSLVPFHNFSPALKSIVVASRSLSLSEVFGLICTLPLLEDLRILCHGMGTSDDDGPSFQSSTSPVLSGTLLLHLPKGVGYTARRLLDLPNGLHFREFVCTLYLEEDIRWITALVGECSESLECIEINCSLSRTSLRPLP